VTGFVRELATRDKMKILTRNLYGFFVVERSLMRCRDENISKNLRTEINSSIQGLSDKNLKTKWKNLLTRNY
jgi:hypothetical protein